MIDAISHPLSLSYTLHLSWGHTVDDFESIDTKPWRLWHSFGLFVPCHHKGVRPWTLQDCFWHMLVAGESTRMHEIMTNLLVYARLIIVCILVVVLVLNVWLIVTELLKTAVVSLSLLRSREKTNHCVVRNQHIYYTIAAAILSLAFGIISRLNYKSEHNSHTASVRPAGWESFKYDEMMRYFECDKAFDTTPPSLWWPFSTPTPRPWWTDEEFRVVRELYHDLFKSEKKAEGSDDSGGTTQAGTYQASDEVFDFSQIAVPFQTGWGGGRGLKAARDIKQGEMISKDTNNTIIFTDALSYRKFLFALNERFPTYACDIMIWAWVEEEEEDTEEEDDDFVVVVDLDHSNLLNTGDRSSENNVKCDSSGPEGRCKIIYAVRDIMKGEELLGDYDEFSTGDWDDMDL